MFVVAVQSDFQGELITSYIDGAQVLHFPSHKRIYYMTQSLLGVALLLVLALGVVVSIYIIRFTIEDDIGVGRAQIVASLLNSAQIQVRLQHVLAVCLALWFLPHGSRRRQLTAQPCVSVSNRNLIPCFVLSL